MVPHEGGDEIVRVVIHWLQADLDRVASLPTSSREVPRLELGVHEAVSCSLVNKNARLWSRIVLN